jgi:hypothetical protein
MIPSLLPRISFQIRFTEGTNDERGEPNDESAGRPIQCHEMFDYKTRPQPFDPGSFICTLRCTR